MKPLVLSLRKLAVLAAVLTIPYAAPAADASFDEATRTANSGSQRCFGSVNRNYETF